MYVCVCVCLCVCMCAHRCFYDFLLVFCVKERTNNIFTGFNFLGVIPAVVRVRVCIAGTMKELFS